MIAPPWVTTLFQALDAFDADTFASFLEDDAVFVFGNSDPVRGKQTIRNVVAGFFTTLKAIRHDLIETWVLPEAVICQGTVNLYPSLWKSALCAIRKYLPHAERFDSELPYLR
jgi:uncharacterized protein (TIGR02246 family)